MEASLVFGDKVSMETEKWMSVQTSEEVSFCLVNLSIFADDKKK